LPFESKAIAGSDPKSKPLLVRGGGSGRSTPVNVAPPSVEYIARIGRRWISFEPAITFCWFAGLIAIEVSLCEPHSWLASTFDPKASCPTEPELLLQVWTAPPETERYLSNQEAPSYELRFPASAGAALASAARTIAKASTIRFMCGLPFLTGLIDSPISQSTCRKKAAAGCRSGRTGRS
jgi:hypothetical protein